MNQAKLLLLGATAGVGRHVLGQALGAGHEVTAFVRDPARLTTMHPKLHVVVGDVTAGGPALAEATRGQDAVISALGVGKSLDPGGLIERAAPAILAAMQQHDVRRLLFTSAIGVGDAYREAPLIPRLLIRVLLRRIYADKEAGESLIRASDRDWTLVQPAALTDHALTGRYRTGEHLRARGAPSVGRADVAHYLLSLLDDRASIRKVLRMAY
jgi:putative NADH-flavin reductase